MTLPYSDENLNKANHAIDRTSTWLMNKTTADRLTSFRSHAWSAARVRARRTSCCRVFPSAQLVSACVTVRRRKPWDARWPTRTRQSRWMAWSRPRRRRRPARALSSPPARRRSSASKSRSTTPSRCGHGVCWTRARHFAFAPSV